MKLIVGLGNPGKQYQHTRHNAGFEVIDLLIEELKITLSQEKFNALIATHNTSKEKFIIMKPLTFMNNSGEAVLACANYYKINPEDIIIIHDDLDLPNGKVRIRKDGNSGGQKGVQDIINKMGTNQMKRIRIGIGKDQMIPIIDYVLGKVKKEDREEYQKSLIKAKDALIYNFTNSFDRVMNRYN